MNIEKISLFIFLVIIPLGFGFSSGHIIEVSAYLGVVTGYIWGHNSK